MTRFARPLTFVGIVAAVALAWIVALPPAPVSQPIAFNHAKHREVGCATCHTGAAGGQRAGIPQGRTCVKCHATAPRGVSAALWDRLSKGNAIEWVRVTRVPDHVMFSHRRHTVLARLDCASCHGDVGARVTPVTTAAVQIQMSTCLSCHTREGASDDCAACHR